MIYLWRYVQIIAFVNDELKIHDINLGWQQQNIVQEAAHRLDW